MVRRVGIPSHLASAIWAGITSIVAIYTFVVFVFLVTTALCSIARPKRDKDYIVVLGSGLIEDAA